MSFRDLQRRYENALPPSYFTEDEPDDPEFPVCYFCGKEIKDGMYIINNTKVECDECVLRRHERMCVVKP